MTEDDFRKANPGVLRMYDASLDDFRSVTQVDVDRLEAIAMAYGRVSNAAREAHRNLSGHMEMLGLPNWGRPLDPLSPEVAAKIVDDAAQNVAERLNRGRPRIEDRGKTIEAQKPWLALGMSRRSWYSRKAKGELK